MTDLGCLGLIQSQFRLFRYDSRPISAYFGRFSQFWPLAYTIQFGQYDLILAKSARFGVNRSRVSTNPKKKKKLIRSTDARAATLVATPRIGIQCSTLPAVSVLPRLESTDTAPRSPHRSPTRPDTASNSSTLPFFFLFMPTRLDSHQFGN